MPSDPQWPYMPATEEREWYQAWQKYMDDAKRDGFYLIHLDPGEMAVKYAPLTQSTNTEIIASRKSEVKRKS